MPVIFLAAVYGTDAIIFPFASAGNFIASETLLIRIPQDCRAA
jgi:hypothetical protein